MTDCDLGLSIAFSFNGGQDMDRKSFFRSYRQEQSFAEFH